MTQLGAGIDLKIIMPEALLLVFAFLILVAVPLRKKNLFSPSLAILAVLASFIAVITLWGQPRTGYFDMVVSDNFALFAKLIFLLTGFGGILLSREYMEKKNLDRPEYYVLLLVSMAGMMMMVSSFNLMVIFLGLEIMSLPLYVLAGFFRNNLKSNEAAAKYFFMGAFASAFFLYGIALIYGGAGTTDLLSLFKSADAVAGSSRIYLIAGAALVLIGFAFKVAAFPFHMWVPDVYQGAPTPVTAFFSVGPKAAGVVTLLRIFLYGFGPVYQDFMAVFWVLAFTTMLIGNIMALIQDDVKRMLAYSSIAHAGYLLIAFTARGEDAIPAALYYLLAYGFFNLGAFALLIILEERNNGSNHIDTYKGLSARSPWLAVLLALFMFSLAGFPPTAGFFGKFYLFSAAVKGGQVWLVVAAVINSLISVVYYLRPVKAAYFDKVDESATSTMPHFALGPMIAVAVALTALGTLGLGLFPGSFLNLATGSVLLVM